MPRLFFNVCAPDQCFCDKTGSEIGDAREVRRYAMHVARRVMALSGLADYHPDLKGWSIAVTDENRCRVDTVALPTEPLTDEQNWYNVPSPQPSKDCLYAVRKREGGWVISTRDGSVLLCKSYMDALGFAVTAAGILSRPESRKPYAH